MYITLQLWVIFGSHLSSCFWVSSFIAFIFFPNPAIIHFFQDLSPIALTILSNGNCFLVIFLGHFCPKGKVLWGYPYVKHQPVRQGQTTTLGTMCPPLFDKCVGSLRWLHRLKGTKNFVKIWWRKINCVRLHSWREDNFFRFCSTWLLWKPATPFWGFNLKHW